MCDPIKGDTQLDPAAIYVPSSPEVLRASLVIRELESGQNYQSNPQHSNGATASGAYQIIDSSWQAWARASGVAEATKYPRAYLAPPTVQDAVARWQIASMMNRYRQVSAVPVNWYWPRAWTNCAELDSRPAGNAITVRAYAEKWLARYNAVTDVLTPGPSIIDQVGQIPGIYGVSEVIGGAAGGLDSLGQIAATVGRAAAWIANPGNWLRILYVLGGAALVAIAAVMLTRDLSPVAAASSLIGR